MFLSSVLVPSSVVPTGRTETLASQRSDPSSMFTSETPIARKRRTQQIQPLPSVVGGMQIRLGDDLSQRCSAAVEVHSAAVSAVDPAARSGVDELRGVLLQVHPMDTDVPEATGAAQRHVVLRDLVALGQVGIEVVLAMELGPRRDLAAQGLADHDPVVHRLGVHHREGSGQSEAARARVHVGGITEGELAPTEHLGPGLELNVDLESDDRLVLGCGAHTAPPVRAGLPSKPNACSSA